jgi:hypothetical protein
VRGSERASSKFGSSVCRGRCEAEAAAQRTSCESRETGRSVSGAASATQKNDAACQRSRGDAEPMKEADEREIKFIYVRTACICALNFYNQLLALADVKNMRRHLLNSITDTFIL